MDIFNPEDPRDALPPTVPLTKSYVNAACSVPLNGITVGEAVEAAAEKRPDHLAYIFSENGLQLTYKDVLEMTRRAAKSYLALGLVKGDHVVIAGVPDENYLSLMFGAVYIGLVINTPAYIFRPKEVHIKQIISKVEPKAFILNPGRNDVDYKALQNLIPNLDDYSLPNALDLEMFPTLKYIVMATSSERREFNLPKFYSLGVSISDADLDKAKSKVGIDDICNTNMTSGSTGEPKLTMLTHFATVNSITFSFMRRGVSHKDVIGVMNPVHEDFLIDIVVWELVQHALEPCMVILPPKLWDVYSVNYTDDDWEPEEVLRLIEKYRVKYCDLYPQFWAKILENPGLKDKYDLSSLKGGILSSMYLSESILNNFKTIVPHLTNALGCSEVYYITMTYPMDTSAKRRYGTIGFPIPHTEVKLVDEDNKIVPIGQKGELCVRSFCVMAGYYKDDEQTRKVLEPTGWYHTGDIGIMDEYGFIMYHGRHSQKLFYNHYGDNIYPAPIEAVVEKHPLVKEAKVVGLPNGAYGDYLVVCATLKNGIKLTVEELQKHVESEVMDTEYPDFYLFMESFPRAGPRQKVSRKDLTEIARNLLIEKGEIEQ